MKEKVAEFYDTYTTKFLEIYDGKTIQGYRPPSILELHEYTAKMAALTDGLNVIDVGCGVCGPAVFFAKKYNLKIEGITISNQQKIIGEEYVRSEHLENKITITLGDFHYLENFFAENYFDRAMFIESIGHSYNLEKAIQSISKVLKKGAKIYIKEVFRKKSYNKAKQDEIDTFFEKMNACYAYNTPYLEDLIHHLRQNEFEIDFIKKIDYQNDTSFRDLFEETNNINLFENDKYYNPGEWLEILCTKGN